MTTTANRAGHDRRGWPVVTLTPNENIADRPAPRSAWSDPYPKTPARRDALPAVVDVITPRPPALRPAVVERLCAIYAPGVCVDEICGVPLPLWIVRGVEEVAYLYRDDGDGAVRLAARPIATLDPDSGIAVWVAANRPKFI